MVHNIKELRSVKNSGEHLQRINKFRNCGRCESDAKQELFSFSMCQSLTNYRKEVLFSMSKELPKL